MKVSRKNIKRIKGSFIEIYKNNYIRCKIPVERTLEPINNYEIKHYGKERVFTHEYYQWVILHDTSDYFDTYYVEGYLLTDEGVSEYKSIIRHKKIEELLS